MKAVFLNLNLKLTALSVLASLITTALAANPAKPNLHEWGTCKALTPEAVVISGDVKRVKPAVRADVIKLYVTDHYELVADLKGSALLNDNGKMLIDDKNYEVRYQAKWSSSIGSDYTEFSILEPKDQIDWMRFTVEVSDQLDTPLLTVNVKTTYEYKGKTYQRFSSTRFACDLQEIKRK